MGQNDSRWTACTDESPDIPTFQSGVKKKKGSTVDALGGVMDAVARIVEQKTHQDQVKPPGNSGVPVAGVSPGKAAELRMKIWRTVPLLTRLI